MRNGEETKCVFPMTSLQIGDLQSYLSDLSIFMANKSKKIYILVDNRPWLNPGTRSAHFWKLMVTKSRLSLTRVDRRHNLFQEQKYLQRNCKALCI
ncbi:unnamed protein product [Brassica oleracea var. botrytis]|uniref:(rape) hypothetical protein n=1 Tax=Brassica napus TaxID=3708 RepID=A0A816J1F9_BRANA|nr:unnamed protein product [Brassica napus]